MHIVEFVLKWSIELRPRRLTLSCYTYIAHLYLCMLICVHFIYSYAVCDYYSLYLSTLYVLYIPDLIQNFTFNTFFYTSYFPYDCQNGFRSRKSNGQNNESEHIYPMSCRYLNLLKYEGIVL
jgi:hypothetical protein